MKKLVIMALLAATAATPALAQRNDNPRWVERAKERAVRTGEPDARLEELARQPREARGDRRVYRDVRQNVPAPTGEVRRDRRGDRGDFRRERREDRAEFRRDRRDDRRAYRDGDVTRGEFRRERYEDRRDYRQDRRADRRDYRNDRRWDRNWRQDRRYDWRSHRNYNRNAYRVGRYYAPYGYGYGYRRYGIGLTLNSIFFGSRYWLNDPWAYRLPDPGYGYRWVRYYNDVLLVDTRSGYIVDVIHDFFW